MVRPHGIKAFASLARRSIQGNLLQDPAKYVSRSLSAGICNPVRVFGSHTPNMNVNKNWLLLGALNVNFGAPRFIHGSAIMSKNHYEVLGVRKDASQSEIKKAYYGVGLKFWNPRYLLCVQGNPNYVCHRSLSTVICNPVRVFGSHTPRNDDCNFGLPRNIHGSAIMSKNYYEVLGVRKDANLSEIKKAYYGLAKKLHPDQNRDDPDAKKKFQEVSKAYEVLKDDEKRRVYGQVGHDEFENQGYSQQPGGDGRGFLKKVEDFFIVVHVILQALDTLLRIVNLLWEIYIMVRGDRR